MDTQVKTQRTPVMATQQGNRRVEQTVEQVSEYQIQQGRLQERSEKGWRIATMTAIPRYEAAYLIVFERVTLLTTAGDVR